MHKQLYTLNMIKLGEKVQVHKLLGKGEKRRRLAEMGITPDTVISIKRIAPLGDPIEISLRGYELSLRKEDAKMIEVTRVSENPGPDIKKNQEVSYV